MSVFGKRQRPLGHPLNRGEGFNPHSWPKRDEHHGSKDQPRQEDARAAYGGTSPATVIT
jgi:hypothetical protein